VEVSCGASGGVWGSARRAPPLPADPTVRSTFAILCRIPGELEGSLAGVSSGGGYGVIYKSGFEYCTSGT